MRTETHRLFKDLLGLHGYDLQDRVADARLGEARTTDAATPTPGLSPQEPAMNLVKSLWLLGGLQSIDTRVDEAEARVAHC